MSLTSQEQNRLRKNGTLAGDQMLAALIPGLSVSEIDKIEIDEEKLGFDSLAILDLILLVNRFFGLDRSGVEDYLFVRRSLGEWVQLITQHFQIVGDEAEIIFSTSGSAGPAKHVRHSMASLVVEVDALNAGPLSHILPRGRVLSMVPPHHIYGFLMTCLWPSRCGREVLDLHQLPPSAVFRMVRPSDVIVGTPFNWQLLNRTAEKFPYDVFGITSAGPSTSATWDVVEQNGLINLTEIYGATETGGIGTRQSCKSEFVLLPHLERSGTKIISTGNDLAVLPVQDRLDWSDDRHFTLLGRKDDVVQIAGVNVSPKAISGHIAAFGGVATVAVRPDNERLKAFIVPQPDVKDLEEFASDLRKQIQQTLPAVARPGSLTFGSELPTTSMGKPADW